MTQEEKAKAYDGNCKVYIKLINRLEYVKNAIKKQNYGIAMDILCKPYPDFQITTSTELKESEDERIRKCLLYVIEHHPTLPTEEAEEYLAWLEKQGEQKPTEDVDLPEFESYLCLMFQKFRTKGMCTNGEIIDYVNEHSQKLRDILVKPAWSEEDENIIEWLIGYLEYQIMNATITEEKNNCSNAISMLKSLKERCTWKPSEEQMKALNYYLKFYIDKDGVFGSQLVKLYHDLLKLRKE